MGTSTMKTKRVPVSGLPAAAKWLAEHGDLVISEIADE
jgi:hypothetical protein